MSLRARALAALLLTASGVWSFCLADTRPPVEVRAVVLEGGTRTGRVIIQVEATMRGQLPGPAVLDVLGPAGVLRLSPASPVLLKSAPGRQVTTFVLELPSNSPTLHLHAAALSAAGSAAGGCWSYGARSVQIGPDGAVVSRMPGTVRDPADPAPGSSRSGRGKASAGGVIEMRGIAK